MSTTDQIRQLEEDMVGATFVAEVEEVLDFLRSAEWDQAAIIAMTIFIGETIAKHPGIADPREAQLESVIRIMRFSFERNK